MNFRFSAVRGIRVVWLIAMLAMLVFWVNGGFSGTSWTSTTIEEGEHHLLVILVLIALTFPSGLFWVVALNILAYALSAIAYRPPIPDLLLISFVWVGFIALGYFQWFRLVPWLWRKWRSRKASNPAQSA